MDIINAIIENQHYPTRWKMLILKQRLIKPTSNLISTINKVGEGIIYKGINEEIEERGLLPNNHQYGFRQSHSTKNSMAAGAVCIFMI